MADEQENLSPRAKRNNLLRLLRQTRPYRKKLIFGLVAGQIVTAAAVSLPVLTRRAIDNAVLGNNLRLLVWIIVVIAVIGITRSIFHGTRRQIAGEVSISTEADLREELYEHVQALDMNYHQEVSTGQIMARASSDLLAIRNFIVFIPLSLAQATMFISAGAIMFSFDPILTAVALFALPFLAVATVRFMQKFDNIIWNMQQKLADFASHVEETVTGIRVVKAFGREAHQSALAEKEARQIYDFAIESIRLRAWFGPLYNLLPQIGIVGVLWVGGHRVLDGHITIGTLVAFNAYLMLLLWPLRTIGMLIANAQRASTASGRVFDVLDTEPGIADLPGAQPIKIEKGVVTFRGVHFSYPGSSPVLNGIDLEIPPGTSLALVGPTGCGKSTLARLLPRFIEPREGQVLVDGVDMAEVTLRSLRRQIGIVFEDTFLFSDSIEANIAFGRPDVEFDEVVRAAVVAHAHEFIEKLPEGYRSVIGEQGYTLSGGQRQRVAIARAVLMNPKLLILDDATSNVDAQVEASILEGLRDVMVDRTTLIVSRRPSTAGLADKVAFMVAGKIVAVGTHEELWSSSPEYRDALVASGQVDRLVQQVTEAASS